MDFYELMDNFYENMCNDLLKNHPLSVHDLKNFEHSNRKVHQDLYFQDYLRLRTIAALEVYHEYLRDPLISVAGIDLGELPL